jgi:hypothetical protein
MTHQDECQQVYFGGVVGCGAFVCYRDWSCGWYVVSYAFLGVAIAGGVVNVFHGSRLSFWNEAAGLS